MDTEKIKVNVKRFFSNPNTLTFLLVILLIVGIYFVYSYMISRATQPTTVPYALNDIYAKSEITTDSIGTVKISGSFVSSSGSGLVTSTSLIYGKYVADGYMIPAKSFFYKEMLADEQTAEKNVVADAPDGYTVFSLDVDFDSTYGCSIMSGNYIDIYVKMVKNQKVYFDKFIESIKVTKVVDSKGNDVFATLDESTGKKPTPAKIYFIVPTDYYKLLKKATLITDSMELIPVPRNAGYSENPKETSIANEAIEQFILSESYYIDD